MASLEKTGLAAAELERRIKKKKRSDKLPSSTDSLVVDWYDGGVGEEVRGPSAAVGAAYRLGAG